MTVIVIEAVAATYLLILAVSVDTHNLPSLICFRVAPALCGLPLAGLAFGRFMGWPI